MKILITAASSSSSISGVQRHAFNVVRCLLQRSEISEVHVAIAPWQRELVQSCGLDAKARVTVHIANMERSSIGRNLWYYRRLPPLAARLRADVVHLSYPVPIHRASMMCPAVVTLHDLYPYEIPLNFGFPQVIANRLILQQCLESADAIACVSTTTHSRLKQYEPARIWRKAVRIYNRVEPERMCSVESPIPGWIGQPFLLCVAQHRRNKNIPLLIKAFDRLLSTKQIEPETKLVVIGIPGPESEKIYRLVAGLGLTRKVHFLQGLSEPQLQWCYARCEALVAPSRTEGFGLPVAEGLLAGCRVVCSDIPVLREIGGEHCRFVNLSKDAERALASAIALAVREPAKAPVTLPQFSAEVLAEQYIRLYRELIASFATAQSAEFSPSIQAPATERQLL